MWNQLLALFETFFVLMSSKAEERPWRKFIGVFDPAEEMMRKATQGGNAARQRSKLKFELISGFCFDSRKGTTQVSLQLPEA